MASPVERLEVFLRKHVVSGAPQSSTHTSMQPKKAYCIEDDDLDTFYELYSEALDSSAAVVPHVTEKHASIGPVVIDLDFHYTPTEGDSNEDARMEGRCPSSCIVEFTKLYLQTINEYVILPPEGVDAFIFLKDEMVMCKKGAAEVVKDGVHIVIPEVVTAPSIQIAARQKMLQALPEVFDPIVPRLCNTFADVFDKKVISSAPWTMYGGSKPGCKPYTMRNVVRVSQAGVVDVMSAADFTASHSTQELVKMFSIRNKHFSTPVTPSGEHEVQQAQASKQTQLANQVPPHVAVLKGAGISEDREFIKKLVDILDPWRHEDYEAWIQLGFCLHNIDASFSMMDVWIDFSRKSAKFQEGQCEIKWAGMRDANLGLPTLHYWAKHDNPEAYRNIIKECIFHQIVDARSGCEVPVARVVFQIYKYSYKCVSISRKQWYEFRRHRWVSCDSGYTLRNKLSEEVSHEFLMVADHFEQKAAKDEENKDKHMEYRKQLIDIAHRLQTRRFLDNVMHECCPFFYEPDFESALDEKPHLIGFENGVYDLQDMSFREGRPDDMITLSTKTDFVHIEDIADLCDESDRNVVQEIEAFFEQVLANENVRTYFLTMLASFLHGDIKNERFHIFTAGGSNGKSKTVELFERSFGEYCVKLPVALLTQKRAASNSATSEIARTKGKRFACLQEPGEDEKLNIGLLKELSGGDTILARALYREPVEFKPQFKLVLVCNHLPNVPAQDFGTWRRIRVIQFLSKFCEEPKQPNEFPVDIDLSRKITRWRRYFLSFLIHKYYPMYSKDFKLTEPDEIMSYTNQYKQASDVVACFMKEFLAKSEDGFLPVMEVFPMFQAEMAKKKVPNPAGKDTFIKQAQDLGIGEVVEVNGVEGFRGWKFVNDIYNSS